VVFQVGGFTASAVLSRSRGLARRSRARSGSGVGKEPRGRLQGWQLGVLTLVLCLLLVAAPSHAALIELMLDAPSESEATAAGLDEVLVQMAGFRSPALSRLSETMLEDSDRSWLRSLERRGAERFLLAFDRARLRAAVQDAGAPVWVGSRPALLVWVVLEREDRRLLLGSGMDEDSVLASLRTWAVRRDLPLLFPLADLEDRRQVHIADVVGGVTEALVGPSRRYDPDGLMLLHLFERGDRVRARAWLSYRGHEVQSDVTAGSAAAAATEAAAEGIDQLGVRLARVLVEEASALVGFSGVAGMADLQSLRARLNALEAVQSVRVHRLLPGAAVLAVDTGLEPRALADVLAGEGFAAADTPSGGTDIDLWFRSVR